VWAALGFGALGLAMRRRSTRNAALSVTALGALALFAGAESGPAAEVLALGGASVPMTVESAESAWEGGVIVTQLSLRGVDDSNVLHEVKVNPFEALAGDSLQDAALLLLVAIIGGGVREELQRAFLLDRFERYLGPGWLGVVLLSIAFGLGHLPQGQDAAIATGAMGAFWAVVYLRRRSSVAPMVSHALFNALQVATIVAMNR
jgi:membrane protease YdiL (CAAX protease family)